MTNKTFLRVSKEVTDKRQKEHSASLRTHSTISKIISFRHSSVHFQTFRNPIFLELISTNLYLHHSLKLTSVPSTPSPHFSYVPPFDKG